MAAAFQQDKQATATGTGFAVAITFDAAVASGNDVFVGVAVNSTTATVTVTDNQSNTYTEIGSARTLSHAGIGSNGTRLRWYKSKNITNAPTTVTATLNTDSIQRFISAWAMSGIHASTDVDEDVNSGTHQVGTEATVSFTTDTAAELALACIGVGAVRTLTAGAGWTADWDDSSLLWMHRECATATSYTANCTISSSAGWNATALSIRGAVSSGGLFRNNPSGQLSGLGSGGPFFQNPLQ